MSVSARFVFFRIFEGSHHEGSHTIIGWASWAGILAVTWIVPFIIAEAIPRLVIFDKLSFRFLFSHSCFGAWRI